MKKKVLTILRKRGSKEEESLCKLSTFKASTITLWEKNKNHSVLRSQIETQGAKMGSLRHLYKQMEMIMHRQTIIIYKLQN